MGLNGAGQLPADAVLFAPAGPDDALPGRPNLLCVGLYLGRLLTQGVGQADGGQRQTGRASQLIEQTPVGRRQVSRIDTDSHLANRISPMLDRDDDI